MQLARAALIVAWCFAWTSRADDGPKEIWAARCKSCHGPDGRAKTKIGIKEGIEDMTTAKWQAEFSNEEIVKIVTHGSEKKGSKMKAFEEKLSAAEIRSLVRYIRAMEGS